ncbi:MAG: SUMF1/EgtB/PvdO family nonheme iron enzyme, partial [Planctomycetes bacterium]|nr:SUMF1/EgtB/PvdO family nonheme iron enzyme [Planctomycetota bacterium]
KSTTLRYFAWQLAASPGRAFVPVLLHLPRWLRDPGFGGDNSVAAIFGYVERTQGVTGLADALDRLGDHAPLLVLLDGYDELRPAERERAKKLLASLCYLSRATIVVAARSSSRPDVDETLWHDVVLQALERTDQRRLASRVFRSRRGDTRDADAWAGELLRAIDQLGLRVQTLATNPLFLTLLAELKLAGQPLGDRRHRVLDQMVRLILAGDYAEQTAPVADGRLDEAVVEQTVRPLLGRIAWWMIERSGGVDGRALLAFCKGEKRERKHEKKGRKHTGNHKEQDEPTKKDRKNIAHQLAALRRALGVRDSEQALLVLAERAPLLVPEDRADGAWWSFQHRHLQEYLAAEHWRAELGADPDTVADKLRELTTGDEQAVQDSLDLWTEPIALLLEQVDGGDRLLTGMLGDETQRALGLRVLRSLEDLGADALRGSLAALPEWKWAPGEVTARVPFYEALQVPGKLEELPASLTLLVEHAADPKTTTAEIGAIVDCLQRLARADEAHRGEIERAIAEIVSAPRFGALTRELFEQWFRQVEHTGTELWCRIPQGESEPLAFTMGEGDAVFDVTFERPFWAGATTVTIGQYERMVAHRHRWGNEDPSLPVTEVSWFEAVLFCAWFEHQCRRLFGTGLPSDFRVALPSDAQWEFLARAGTPVGQRFWSGNGDTDLARVGWYGANSKDRVHSVARLAANPWGLHDVHGNVWEWTGSWFGDLGAGPDRGGPSSGAGRVQRGGSYGYDADHCRSANRNWYHPDVVWGFNGFRVVLSAPPPPSS